MNSIFKKVISAAIAVSTLGSIALPAYAAETPEISEDTVATAENNERMSFKEYYYNSIEFAQDIAYAFQSSDLTSDWVHTLPDADPREYEEVKFNFAEFAETNGEKYSKYSSGAWAYVAPNGRLFDMVDVVAFDEDGNNYSWYADIMKAIEKGDSKVIDGRTFVTIDGFDYEYYLGEPYIGAKGSDYEGHECAVLFWNFGSEYDIPSMLHWYVECHTDEIESVFDTLQEAYDLTKELIESDTISHSAIHSINRKEGKNRGDYSMPDNDDAILKTLKQEFSYAIEGNAQKCSTMDEFREMYGNCIEEIESLAECVISKEYYKEYYRETLFDSYIGDINGDGKVDVNDVTLLKKQLIRKVELLPVQQKITSTTGNDELDVRDLTKLTQYLVKATDSLK